jgi:hypothetical protein
LPFICALGVDDVFADEMFCFVFYCRSESIESLLSSKQQLQTLLSIKVLSVFAKSEIFSHELYCCKYSYFCNCRRGIYMNQSKYGVMVLLFKFLLGEQ